MRFKRFALLFIATIFAIYVNAQRFVSPSDITVQWKYWSDSAGWDFLINNGTPASLSCIPNFNYDGISLTNPAEICATFHRNNKFLVISFSNDTNIRMCTAYGRSSIALQGGVPYVQTQSWYEIDFEHIIYDPIFDCVMIPCGIDYNGYHNAICIEFNDTASGIKDRLSMDEDEENEEDVKYYDLQGKQVELDDTKGQILIKSGRKNTQKIFNR